MRRVFAVVTLVIAAPAARAEDRCAAGLELAASRPHVAFVHLEACLETGDATAPHRTAHRELKRRLDNGDYALITIAATPADAAIVVEPIGAAVTTGRIYLPPGRYTLSATAAGHAPLSRPLEITGRYRETVELALVAGRTDRGTTTVDLTGEPGRTEIARGKDPEHENLIPDKYRRGEPIGGPGGDVRSRRSRWPYIAVAAGVIAAGVGVGLHLADNTDIATGLFIGGVVGVAVGATGLILRW
jgi:hypothetical protein